MKVLNKSTLKRLALTVVLISGAGAAYTVYAQEQENSVQVQDSKYPVLQLSAQSTEQVSQDTVVLILSKEVRGKDQTEVSRELNAHLQKVVNAGKTNTALKLSTGGYQMWFDQGDNNPDPKVHRDSQWIARADIYVKSQDFDGASKFAQSVDQDANLTGVNFSLSQEAKDKVEKRLLDQAAKSFQDKAQSAAIAFGYMGYEIKTIGLNQAAPSGPMPYAAKAMMMRAAAAPVADNAPLESGQEAVSVTVTGRVVLKK